MSACVCLFWIGYWLACPARRLIHDPVRMLGPLVRAGMRPPHFQGSHRPAEDWSMPGGAG